MANGGAFCVVALRFPSGEEPWELERSHLPPRGADRCRNESDHFVQFIGACGSSVGAARLMTGAVEPSRSWQATSRRWLKEKRRTPGFRCLGSSIAQYQREPSMLLELLYLLMSSKCPHDGHENTACFSITSKDSMRHVAVAFAVVDIFECVKPCQALPSTGCCLDSWCLAATDLYPALQIAPETLVVRSEHRQLQDKVMLDPD